MDIFSALADPTRRNIVEILAGRGELSASEICDKFSISPPAISQHLKVLRDTKLVKVEKHAQQRLYHINPAAIDQLDHWVKKMRKNWEERFTALDTVLAHEKKR